MCSKSTSIGSRSKQNEAKQIQELTISWPNKRLSKVAKGVDKAVVKGVDKGVIKTVDNDMVDGLNKEVILEWTQDAGVAKE